VSRMIMLGIETSGRTGSVAVCDDGDVLASWTFPEGARRGRDIMTAVDRVVSEAELERRDISAVAVSEGPGSFTGLRVGVACAKTLAYALHPEREARSARLPPHLPRPGRPEGPRLRDPLPMG